MYQRPSGCLFLTLLQEILTGRIPFSEIRADHQVIKAVLQDRRTPDVPELEEPSERAAVMLDTLHRCWTYKPNKRATANRVQQLMNRKSKDDLGFGGIFGGWDFVGLPGF